MYLATEETQYPTVNAAGHMIPECSFCGLRIVNPCENAAAKADCVLTGPAAAVVWQYDAPPLRWAQDVASGEGVKHDADKLRFDLIPPDAMTAIAAVLTYGAVKYADRNWEKGMDRARLRAAAERHRIADLMGEERDDETGLPHKAHEACCILMELALFLRNVGTDSAADIPTESIRSIALIKQDVELAIRRVRAKQQAQDVVN
jgi:hypothetical protein